MTPQAQIGPQDISIASRDSVLTDALLSWYATHKRTLPWRGADPYGVWVSEIMLQQTQVATVVPYYLRFMARFPTLESLAEADVDAVLQLWSGLGYYARARNLHRAAQIVAEFHDAKLPDTMEAIRKLPGIGEYTAGAVLSIAYGKRHAAVDANVIRVICRVFGIDGDPKSSVTAARVREAAERLVPEKNAGDYTQAIMELGALVCAPAEPACYACPLLSWCEAGNSADPTALPEYPAGKGSTTAVHSCLVVLNQNGDALITQRPLHGLWGGLWEFPRVICHPDEAPDEAARRAVREACGLQIEGMRKLITVKHSVTRYRITLHAYLAKLDEHAFVAGNMECRWAPIANLGDYAFSSPQSLVREALTARPLTSQIACETH